MLVTMDNGSDICSSSIQVARRNALLLLKLMFSVIPPVETTANGNHPWMLC